MSSMERQQASRGTLIGINGAFHKSSWATYKAKRLSSVRSAFLRLLLGAFTGSEGSPIGGDGSAASAALARSSKNLSNSERETKNSNSSSVILNPIQNPLVDKMLHFLPSLVTPSSGSSPFCSVEHKKQNNYWYCWIIGCFSVFDAFRLFTVDVT